ncbi:MAG TPA: PASTA domain-containing protein [Micromonosporaceae bacterium]|nr:PASTA domain-containing protein [Micromonosporaceae bacterium]
MSTDWVVTTAAERIGLDAQKRGEATFTVTNPNGRADQAVFDVVPGNGADPTWFTVDEPQRLVRGNASVAYLLKVAVAPGAPAGAYPIQGRVYSANSAPEESSVLSGRVMLDVEPEPEPVRRRIPWWVVAVAALVAMVLGVVGWLALTPDPVPLATVPDLLGKTEAQAVDALRRAGLTAGRVTHRHNPAKNDAVLTQSVQDGNAVAPGTPVDFEVSVALAAPTPATPANEARFARNAAPPLTWKQSQPFVTMWTVSISEEYCILRIGVPAPVCAWMLVDEQATSSPLVDKPQLAFLFPVSGVFPGLFHSGRVQWTVVAIDDFGNKGPSSAAATYQINP